MSTKFSKATDSQHKVKLESSIVSASWLTGLAIGGSKAPFEVRTEFVGSGATADIVGKTGSGKTLGKTKVTVTANRGVGCLDIPDDIERGESVLFEVKLSKHGLSAKSEKIPAVPPIGVTEMKWSATEARRGDIVTLSARVVGIDDGKDVRVAIYEYDSDGSHDRITEIPATVKDGKVEITWEYEYHEDTDEIPTEQERQRYGRAYNPPEYFFTIKVGGAEYGRKQESGLLVFKDFVDITLMDVDGKPVADAEYKLILPDGSERSGTLDGDGRARVEDVPPGRYRVTFPKLGRQTDR
ncbi:MAG: carboxypeptidase-like regulatory domain-containing protein [candidate division Zixibacteria bacterium]|nr:carboxypeptidase-like regulatory domain-containing protein [candidate division Zixibacteria bacterium]